MKLKHQVVSLELSKKLKCGIPNRSSANEKAMLTVRKRGKVFRVDLMAGKIHLVRGSLGTHNGDAARRIAHKLETALAEGPLSSVWADVA